MHDHEDNGGGDKGEGEAIVQPDKSSLHSASDTIDGLIE